ncbi:MAG: zinc ribbon domain-containing protein [Cyanobacteria bacterium P01_G01_bin.49]
MVYVCELSPNQKVYLENSEEQTVITTTSAGIGQQQQSSSRFQTGSWILPPQVYPIPQGIIILITATNRKHWVQIQGNSMSMLEISPSLENTQPIPLQQVTQSPVSSIPPMQPMQPMQPMKMGEMQMNINPMEMRMGNMEMRMGETSPPQKKFCPQCGNKVQSGDRFCSNCGHNLA